MQVEQQVTQRNLKKNKTNFFKRFRNISGDDAIRQKFTDPFVDIKFEANFFSINNYKRLQ